MRRWLDWIVCCLSLLLCATAVVFWVRSYRHWDSLILMNSKNQGVQIETFPGLLDCGFIWVTNAFPTSPGVQFESASSPHGPHTRYQIRWGFGFDHYHQEIQHTAISGASIANRYDLILPFWFIVLVALFAPVWVLARRLRQNYRVAQGLCLSCGYDLRASIDRCPECGGAIPQPAAH